MTAARGKTFARLTAVMGAGTILGGLIVLKNPFLQWLRVRQTLATPCCYLECDRVPLESVLQVLSRLSRARRGGEEEFGYTKVRFALTSRAAGAAEKQPWFATFEVKGQDLETTLRTALASTGRKFRYWIKGDSVMIDLDE